MVMAKNGGCWKLEVICVCWKKGSGGDRCRRGSIWVDLGVLGGVGAVEKKDVSPFWELISKQGGIRRDLGLGL